MVNDVYLDVFGKGVIDVPNGSFNNVLCILDIKHNILSVYQIAQIGISIDSLQIQYSFVICIPNTLLQWGQL